MGFISKEIIEYSLRGIAHRKTRSFLTILSIMIGIVSIFIFVSFGIGLYNYVQAFSTGSSTDKLMIMSKGFGGSPISEDFFLSKEELRKVKQAPGVYDASGIYYKATQIQQDKIKKYAFMISYDPQKPIIMDISNVELSKGRALENGDSGKVVLGYNYLIKDKIFPKAYQLNEKINLDGSDFRIVGFYAPVGNPQDDAQIYMNNDYFENVYPNNSLGYNWIVAKVDISRIREVIQNIENTLRKYRGEEKGKETFFVQSFEDLLKTYTTVLNLIVGFVIMIALISVFVSAINTSNTMITSVLERIREIGIMKSVGARNSEILKIFLFESETLGFLAGLGGVIIGFLISKTLSLIIVAAGWGFLSPAFPWYLFAGCILFATLTGAISGVAPAIKASKINPVQALRYE